MPRLAEMLVEATQHVVGEAAHLERPEPGVRLRQAKTAQSEPLVGTFKVAFQRRRRQRQRGVGAAQPLARRARQHDARALLGRHRARGRQLPGQRRPSFAYARLHTLADEREVVVERVLPCQHGEGDERLGKPRRPVVLARIRFPVAVEQLLEHNRRIRLVRILGVQHALAHHRLAGARKRAEESAAGGGERVCGAAEAQLLQKQRAAVLDEPHRVGARVEIAQHERGARARGKLGRLVERHEQRVGAPPRGARPPPR